MGERKGTNLYYPPDYDPKKGGLNKFLGTHALRERARKLHMGILIIRFEMPYNIWCDGCNNHIGMGVRYNAEKKKVGMYYSTPVYQFRMKCHLCDNHFEIKTDPANFDYVIVSGARRQENRWDPTQNEQVVPEDKNTSKKLFDDAMFKLEHGEKDQKGAKSLVPTLSRLAAMREDRWQDDYSANCALRQRFRAAKQAQKNVETRDRAVKSKFGLDIPLLPEVDSDVRLAKLLVLKPSQSIFERQSQSRRAIAERPILPSSKRSNSKLLCRPIKRSHSAEDKNACISHSKVLVRTCTKGQMTPYCSKADISPETSRNSGVDSSQTSASNFIQNHHNASVNGTNRDVDCDLSQQKNVKPDIQEPGTMSSAIKENYIESSASVSNQFDTNTPLELQSTHVADMLDTGFLTEEPTSPEVKNEIDRTCDKETDDFKKEHKLDHNEVNQICTKVDMSQRKNCFSVKKATPVAAGGFEFAPLLRTWVKTFTRSKEKNCNNFSDENSKCDEIKPAVRLVDSEYDGFTSSGSDDKADL